jgi:alpha-galactosidase
MQPSDRLSAVCISAGSTDETIFSAMPSRMLFLRSIWFLLAMALIAPMSGRALTNGLALKPPMGWNSWNHYWCNINEATIRRMADVMATNGMKAAGYEFINIDDCWQVSRDANGAILADPTRFPSGIKALADYVHSKGLKLGVYSDHGLTTCAGKPGSYGYEYIDANTYASWGVDYLKFDNCNLPAGDVPRVDYLRMADALMKSGRPITFSVCAWAFASWDPDAGNLWRTTGDISDSYSSMLSNLGGNSAPAFLAGPGRWNDPDMLEVGNGGMTFAEYQSHFSLWCIVAAPLIAGNDLTAMSTQTASILTNAELIAVDQDPAGEQGIKLVNTSTNQIWVKPLGYDFSTKAVALFNTNSSASIVSVNWTNIGLQAGAATVRDLWGKTNLGVFTDGFTTNVPSHGVVVLKITGTAPQLPGLGTNYLTSLQPAYGYVGWGSMVNNRSIGGNSLKLNGTTYPYGLGAHSLSGVEYRLGGIASRFQSDIGVDDEVGSNGSVVFQVFADGTKIYDSGTLRGGATHRSINLDVSGVNRLTLGVLDGDDGNSYDHADWAGARLVVSNTVPAAPSAPTGLSARQGLPVALSWNATVSATNYIIKRAIAPEGPYTNIASSLTPSYADNGVPAGLIYYYTVSAVSVFGESSNSAYASALACAPPAAPLGVTALATNRQVVVSWNAVSGASSYNVARALATTPFSLVATGLTTTTYTDTGLTNGVSYSYVVYANNNCALSRRSDFVVATPVAPPVAPTGLTATTGGSRTVLSWNALSTATSYNLKRSINNPSAFVMIATNLTMRYYLNTNLLLGTNYYYAVSAVNAGGEGLDSGYIVAAPCSGGLPLNWTNRDIGSVGLTGSATCCGNSFVMQGGGADIWNAADGFHFASTPLTGDGTNIARVVVLQPTDPWAKAGLMYRNDASAGSAFVDMIISATNGANFQWRSAAGGGCNFTSGPAISTPAWVKLVRIGNTFTGYSSTNGAAWTQVGSITVTMGSIALAGLAVTAHNNSVLCLAAFDSVWMGPPAAPTGLSASADLHRTMTTWNPATGATGYNLRRGLAGSGPYTNLLSLAGFDYADTNVANGTTYYYEVSATNPLGESAYSTSASVAVPLPALSAALTDSRIALSWPVTASKFSLSSTTNLSAPGSWAIVTNAVITVDGQVSVGLLTDRGVTFYRLQRAD